MFKKIITAKSFWKSVLFLFFAFLVLFNLIILGFNFGFHFEAYETYYFKSHRLPSFLVMNIIGGFIYSFATAYYRYYKVLKDQ